MRAAHLVLASSLITSCLLPAAAGGSSLTVREITPEAAGELKARWAESRGSIHERSRLDDTLVIVPFFVVDTTSASGVTTLFAVQADLDVSTPVVIRYEDLFGNQFRSETRTLAPSSVLTVNIRDKNPPVLTAGFAFGRVVIDSTNDLLITGDYYQVDPGGNFGHADGLISVDDLCLIEDVRYATGGIFDDTVMSYHFLQLTTPAMGGLPAAIVEVYTEGGTLSRTFELVLPNFSSRADFISAEFIFDQLGGGPPFGTMRFFWNPDTVGAAVTKAATSAQGRFSVGLQGACRLSLLQAL